MYYIAALLIKLANAIRRKPTDIGFIWRKFFYPCLKLLSVSDERITGFFSSWQDITTQHDEHWYCKRSRCPKCEEHPYLVYVDNLKTEAGYGYFCPICEVELKVVKCSGACKKTINLWHHKKLSKKSKVICQDCRFLKTEKTITGLLKIPLWRLNVDDASPEETLFLSPDEFGMPRLTYEKWKNYYETSEWENQKLREMHEQRNKLAREILQHVR